MNEPQVGITWQDRDDAWFLSLRGRCKSPQAAQFVESVLEDVVVPAWPTGLQRRPSSLQACRLAVAALFADLIRVHAKGRAGKHGMSDKDFVGLGFSRDIFKRVTDALEGLGWLETLGGWRWLSSGFEGSIAPGGAALVRGSSVSCFRLTAQGALAVKGAGLLSPDLESWGEHWLRPKIASTGAVALVELKGRRKTVNGRKQPAPEMSVNRQDPKVIAITAELQAHNDFMFLSGVDGVPFAGLKRVFNNGNVSGFAWAWGGRFASLPGGGYEVESKSDRLAAMRLASQSVAEVDIRASHLTILHQLLAVPFDGSGDPYAFAGIDRELVKRWITQAIGRGDVDARAWSVEARGYYRDAAPGRTLSQDVPISSVRAAVLARYPLLRRVGQPGYSVHDLNFHESEVVSGAMRLLRAQNVPSLPVHDCIIVPVGSVEAGQAAVEEAFRAHFQSMGMPPLVRPSTKVSISDVCSRTSQENPGAF